MRALWLYRREKPLHPIRFSLPVLWQPLSCRCERSPSGARPTFGRGVPLDQGFPSASPADTGDGLSGRSPGCAETGLPKRPTPCAWPQGRSKVEQPVFPARSHHRAGQRQASPHHRCMHVRAENANTQRIQSQDKRRYNKKSMKQGCHSKTAAETAVFLARCLEWSGVPVNLTLDCRCVKRG